MRSTVWGREVMRTNDRELTFHAICKEAHECGSRISSRGEEALFHVFSKMSLASVVVFESVLHSVPRRHVLCEGKWQLYNFFHRRWWNASITASQNSCHPSTWSVKVRNMVIPCKRAVKNKPKVLLCPNLSDMNADWWPVRFDRKPLRRPLHLQYGEVWLVAVLISLSFSGKRFDYLPKTTIFLQDLTSSGRRPVAKTLQWDYLLGELLKCLM